MSLIMPKPADGTNLVQLARNGYDKEARKIIFGLIRNVKDNQPSAEGVPDITKEAALLRGNLDNVGKIFPGLRSRFEEEANRMDARLEMTKASKLILPQYQHHENTVYDAQGDKWISKSGLIVASLADVFGAAVGTNPYDTSLSFEENLKFVLPRLEDNIQSYAEEFEVSPNEVGEGGANYSHVIAAKRCYLLAAGKTLTPELVKPEYFIAIADKVNDLGYRMDLG